MDRAVSPHNVDALFVSQLDVIERVIGFVCAKHHVAATDAEDFESHAKLRLIDDNYAILRKFEGRSALRTYLTIVIERLFLDYRNSAWGKWRPSAEARRCGPIGELLEQLLVRDGYALDEASELLATNHGVTMPRSAIDSLAGRLPVRTRRRFESDDTLAQLPSHAASPDDLVSDRDRQGVADRVSTVLKAVMSRLDTQDRLILALRFEDGRTVADIAGMLRLEPKALYRRVERLLRRLRQALEKNDVNTAAVMEMLESPAVSVEWEGHAHDEIAAPRPSVRKGTPSGA
jgi:RNA polymerase sigma factor (sigma-70 family)